MTSGSPQDPNELQAQLLLARGYANYGLVLMARRQAARDSELDLCQVLVRQRLITEAQAREVREAARLAEVSLGDDDDTRPLPLPRYAQHPVLGPLEAAEDLLTTLRIGSAAPAPSSPAPAAPAMPRPAPSSGRLPRQDMLNTLQYGADAQEPPGARLQDFLGLRFDNLRIMGPLGSGANGVILRAWHERFKCVVALKLLLDQGDNPEAAARFRREAEVLSSLRHPHIVRIAEYGDNQGTPYIAMEFVVGRNLKAIVKNEIERARRLPPLPWLLSVLGTIAEALRHCHEREVIHRDVKPANILIEESSQRAVLVDFGLVKRRVKDRGGDDDDFLSAAGQVVGTPAFMAPEQLDAQGSHGPIGPATDVWGFGATLFYCLTGAPPYPENNAMGIYIALLTRDPRRARDVNPQVPAWLDELCHGCLQRQSDERLALGEVVERLRAGRTA